VISNSRAHSELADSRVSGNGGYSSQFPAGNRTPGDVGLFVDAVADQGHVFEARYFWHQTNDPYVKFLAEFFLRRSNRTTVSRFLPAFLARFPVADSLAKADSSEVLVEAQWAGMRARTACLPYIVSRFIEQPSWTVRELKGLPNIGEYGAQGMGLYIFGLPVFPIDNNVRRVVGRWFGADNEAKIAVVVEAIRCEALETGGQARLRTAHMGVLALGWDSCRSKPACGSCPLSSKCAYSTRAGAGVMVR